MARKNPLVKVAVGLGAMVVLGYLFISTLSDVSSEPYQVRAAGLRQWTVEVDPLRDPNGPALSLRPPRELPMSLFDQVFQRTMESYSTPAVPGIPLVLRRELQGASVPIPEDTLFAMAHAAGLGAVRPAPTCMAVYRTERGREQRLFFALFEIPQFDRFRREVQDQLRAWDTDTDFDSTALAPALLIASSDPGLLGHMPPRDVLERACAASIEAQG